MSNLDQESRKKSGSRTRKALLACVLLLLSLLVVMEFGGYQRLRVSETCYRCLESRDVYEKRLLGICVSWRQWPRTANSLMAPGARPVPLGGGSGIYQQIWGAPCDHRFTRGGFCRYSGIFMHMVSCGAFAEGSCYEHSNTVVASIFDAYRRFGSKDLARRSYRLLFVQDVSGFGPREWALAELANEKEWADWLARAEEEVGLHVEAEGPPPLEHGSYSSRARVTSPAE